MNRLIYKAFVFFLILYPVFDVYAAAWTRKKGEFLGILEFSDESNNSKSLFDDVDENYYRTTYYKLYLEYGLIDRLTVGGYIKDYNYFAKQYLQDFKMTRNVRNDFYSSIFLLHNIYNRRNNLFSLQYSFYLPIRYDNVSKRVNTMDTKYAFEFSLLYGRDGNIEFDRIFDVNFRYFLDMSLNYKMVNDIDYDQITFATTVGIRINDSSSFNLRYEYKYFIKDDLLKKNRNLYSYYEGSDSNQIKLSVNYKFLDNLSTELAFYRTFSDVDSGGFTFSFIFNN